MSFLANIIISLGFCTPTQTVSKSKVSSLSSTTKRMAEWSKALCYNPVSRYGIGSNPAAGFSAFFAFFTNFQNFQGKYLLPGNYRKYETFSLNRACSKVPLDVELYHGPLRPFEKIEVENS